MIETYPKLGLMLIDISFHHSYTLRHQDNSGTRRVQARLFQGGFEDFLSGTFLDNPAPESGPGRRSLLEDIRFYWSSGQPQGFDVNRPTLTSLSYYPLKIIAADWMTYLEVMYHSTKQYEYVPNANHGPMKQMEKLYADLSALQKWSRRNMATSHKLRYVIGFLKHRGKKDQDMESCIQLIEDYEHIASTIDMYNRRLEATAPIVTSQIQISDSQRSLIETENISKLTYLALVFVPLTFVASLFSMNDRIALEARFLWHYFAIAVPACMLVFLIARPPKRLWGLLAAKIWHSRRESDSRV